MDIGTARCRATALAAAGKTAAATTEQSFENVAKVDAFANNVGWRIDYFMASAALKPRLKRAWIESDVHGSDNCPVGVELKP